MDAESHAMFEARVAIHVVFARLAGSVGDDPEGAQVWVAWDTTARTVHSGGLTGDALREVTRQANRFAVVAPAA